MADAQTTNQPADERRNDLPLSQTEGEAAAVDEDMTSGERLLLESKPYWPVIALGIAAAVLAYVLGNLFVQKSQQTTAEPWQALSTAKTETRLTRNTASLIQTGTEFSDEKAGNWALQFAGDMDLQRGLDELAGNRATGMKTIAAAEETYRKIVDAPASSKSTMLQQRSLFSLAYANESLGKFDIAKKLYEQLIEEAPESAFVEVAERGVKRTSDANYAAVFTQFKEWEEDTEEAPGPLVPDRPKVDFDLPEDFGGGDFEAEIREDADPDQDAKSEMPEVDQPSTEMPAEESTDSEPEVEAAEDQQPAAETPAAEMTPAAETPLKRRRLMK